MGKTINPEDLKAEQQTEMQQKDNDAAAAANSGTDGNNGTIDAGTSQPRLPANEAEKAAAGLKEGDKVFIYNPNRRPMRDPIVGDRFPNGQTVRVKELGRWTINQVRAGILRVGKAEDVGQPMLENSDYVTDEEKAEAAKAAVDAKKQ